MANELRWGVLSTARIGRLKVVPGIQRAERCRVVAVASRDRARADSFAASLDIPRVHDSYESLLADPEVDAVYVPLPNHLHAEWSIAAARAGKHVLCEKPLALTAGEAERIFDVAEAEGVRVMEAFMYRLHPSWVAVRELVSAGRIGDLVAVQSWFGFWNDDAADIRNVRAFGGGALYDVGCYCINLSRMLFGGEPRRVESAIVRDPTSGVDVLTSAILEFDAGLASFTCSIRSEDDQRVHVYGTKGRISLAIPFNIPPDRPTVVEVTSGGDAPVAPLTETLMFAAADPYTVEAAAFAAAVLDGRPLPTSPEDAIANLRVIEAVFAAAAGTTAAPIG
ncbi:MAG TPA: Gfo/Idh/MocA family oxidoreductase [Candidatus Limnocylindrales bacterium]|nr:Gfo/Idh/MocA family oxidoreductase [Candidatus Limnocylindrales bacterium]